MSKVFIRCYRPSDREFDNDLEKVMSMAWLQLSGMHMPWRKNTGVVETFRLMMMYEVSIKFELLPAFNSKHYR